MPGKTDMKMDKKMDSKNDKRNDRKNNRNTINGGINKKALAVTLLCAATALAAGGVWACGSVNKSEQQSGYEELSEQTRTDTKETAAAGEGTPADEQELSGYEQSVAELSALGVPIPDKEVDFETLQAETNPDIYAWIYIPDTMIDYPVLQSATDDSYYLNYNIDGTKGYPGCIYTESCNAKDFLDPVTVMYGHNMKNGSMFAGLHKFEDSEYFDSHRYIYIYTPDRLLAYEIFASHKYSDDHILYVHGYFKDTDEVTKYLEEIDASRDMGHNSREGVTVTGDDHILTLSTCVANQSSKRYLVQGVLLNED
jgi:sortase B